jgi:uncharacterized Zn finger protein (UPF0148 family)
VFHPNKNLLAGGNETGKSRVLKHLVWVLGCEPTARTAGSWDSNIVASVELSIGDARYTFLRAGRDQRAAFDADGRLLIGTENVSAWGRFFADKFDFPLKLQRHQEGVFGLAGPEYAVLPFYIDQEGGWARKWGNFTRLTQFAQWEPVVFESFTGLRPRRYFEAKLTRDEVTFKLREARLQAKVQANAYEQVKAMLPNTGATLDESLFAAELKDVSRKVAELAKDEDQVRTDLFDVAQQLQERSAELQMVIRAEQDLVADLAYLSKVPDDGKLTCPTCGKEHGVSFRARMALASDAKDAHQLVLRVRGQLEKLREREATLRAQLKNVTSQMQELHSYMDRRKGNGSISDIVAAKSLTTIALAYDQTRRDLAAHIDELDEDRKGLQGELDGLTNLERVKQVRASYKSSLQSYADRLNIAKAEIGAIRIGARPPMGAGSSGPRIYLAMHMALISTNREFGSGPVFPFIIDTPRQQGLDDPNTAKLLNAIFGHAKSHQIFVANESVPEGWVAPADCAVIKFKKKRELLREAEYKDAVTALAPLVLAMQEAVRVERDIASEKIGEQDASIAGNDVGENADDDEDLM